MDAQNKNTWKSKWGFILAAVGSAVGLGNLWKFPYISYDNGGGGFVLIYLVTILLIGLPIMIAEIIIGKSSKSDVIGAFPKLGQPRWKFFGYLSVFTGVLLLAFYSVVGGWAIAHLYMSVRWLTDSSYSLMNFGEFVSHPGYQIVFHLLFMLLTIGVVMRGIQGGIESLSRRVMPILLLVLLGLAIFSISTGGFSETAAFLFSVNFENIGPKSILEAVGHAFFTLSLGMGAMLTYGAKLSSKEDEKGIVRSALWISGLDTGVALLACLMIFPMLFGMGLECAGGGLDAGGGALFIAIPKLLGGVAGGKVVTVIFFALLTFAALSSSIAMLEIAVSVGERKFTGGKKMNLSRRQITLLTGCGIALLGVAAALSHGGDQRLMGTTALSNTGIEFTQTKVIRSNVCAEALCQHYALCEFGAVEQAVAQGDFAAAYLGMLGLIPEHPERYSFYANRRISGVTVREERPNPKRGIFDIFDYLTSNWLLPIGGLLICIFAGWFLPASIKEAAFRDLGRWSRPVYQTWHLVIRFLAPISILFVIFSALGLI